MAAAAAVGGRLLAEIEETSLDEILTTLRYSLETPTNKLSVDGPRNAASKQAGTATSTKPIRNFPIPKLNGIVARHFQKTRSAPLTMVGRQLPLLYLLIATLIAPPQGKAVMVVDFDGRFELSRVLHCQSYVVPSSREKDCPSATASNSRPPHVVETDLKHVHVVRPAHGSRNHVGDVIAQAEEYMVYGKHASRAREWWGTITIGGGEPSASSSVAVAATWSGWLRIDRGEAPTFGSGISAEEAIAERERRPSSVAEVHWVADSFCGGFQVAEG